VEADAGRHLRRRRADCGVGGDEGAGEAGPRGEGQGEVAPSRHSGGELR